MRLIVLDRDTVDSMRFVALKRRKCGGNGVRTEVAYVVSERAANQSEIENSRFGFWKGNFIP